MTLRTRYGLLATVLLVLSTVAAFADPSAAIPKEYRAVTIFKSVPLPATNQVTSTVVADPQEILSLGYDATGVGMSGLSLSVQYSNSSTGPFVTPVANAAYMASITWNTTPTSGANFKAYPFKYARFTFANGGAVAGTLNNLTGMREVDSHKVRPVTFTYVDLYTKKLSGVLANNGFLDSDVLAGPDPFPVSFTVDGSAAGTGTKKLQYFYSNSETGPFSTWEDQLSAGNQNEVAFTPIDIAAQITPFRSLFKKVRLLNSSGAAYTSNSVHILRRVPLIK